MFSQNFNWYEWADVLSDEDVAEEIFDRPFENKFKEYILEYEKINFDVDLDKINFKILFLMASKQTKLKIRSDLAEYKEWHA